ncbi:hypothetical protein [Croceimicrobium hydrocarbonivorans]|uniref:Uncharacterized protein n=1 Tax=Croceimicrobium hydrocarbonivorans TaxID=2761580 RepID=A0A7H0VJS9_9FLAO|nr:hypothetical protein [Croceimicrobium hydrocarbonivorans]QNR25977.1 hypothetical protein H4K34_09070 [Croceimicrobium hydrocarbonivorans]
MKINKMIKKTILFVASFLLSISLYSQKAKTKDWRLGLTVPVVSVDSYQREMWSGVSASYKGFTLNYYGVLTSEFIAEGRGEFRRLVSQPWVYTSRMSFGYSFMFGRKEESNFKPIVGLYFLTMQGLEPDIDMGFKYKNLVFFISPHFESQSNAKWFPTFGQATSRKIILKFKFQYIL